MGTAHFTVHQIFHRNDGAFTGLEGHRTDGRGGGSAPLQYFNVRRFDETQGLITDVRNADIIADGGSQLDIPVVDGFFIHL